MSERGSRILTMTTKMVLAICDNANDLDNAPSVNIRGFIFAILCAAVVHNFYVPTCREVPGDDFDACFQRKSLHVFKGEERTAADVFHDNAGTTSLKLPLFCETPSTRQQPLQKEGKKYI
jgi:hypothetical protein